MIRKVRSQCLWCKHLFVNKYGRRSCPAFDYDVIPREIMTSSFDHRHPHALDNGTRFEQISDFSQVRHKAFGTETEEKLEAELHELQQLFDRWTEEYGIPPTPFKYEDHDWDE